MKSFITFLGIICLAIALVILMNSGMPSFILKGAIAIVVLAGVVIEKISHRKEKAA